MPRPNILRSTAEELGLDTSRLAVAGDSVGGNMVAVVTQLAKERKGPPIRYQVLLYPVTDAGMKTASYSEFANGPWLTKPAMEWFWNAYAPKKEDRKKITASPLSATTEQLKGLPPALVIVDENDVSARRRRGIRKKAHRGRRRRDCGARPATHHDFAMLNALAGTPACKAAIQLASEKLSAALRH